MSIEIAAHAEADIDLAIEDIADALGPWAAKLFSTRLTVTFARLERHPLSVAPAEPALPKYPELRITPVHRFNGRLVCYQPTPTGIRVLRVIPAGRNLDDVFGP